MIMEERGGKRLCGFSSKEEEKRGWKRRKKSGISHVPRALMGRFLYPARMCLAVQQTGGKKRILERGMKKEKDDTINL